MNSPQPVLAEGVGRESVLEWAVHSNFARKRRRIRHAVSAERIVYLIDREAEEAIGRLLD